MVLSLDLNAEPSPLPSRKHFVNALYAFLLRLQSMFIVVLEEIRLWVQFGKNLILTSIKQMIML